MEHKLTTKKNPHVNSILERIHQVVANMLRSYDLDNQELDQIAPFSKYLATIVWENQCTYHTTLEATSEDLAFGRDMI
eukprot:11523908-Ditylum_brightwellii.AAC.1